MNKKSISLNEYVCYHILNEKNDPWDITPVSNTNKNTSNNKTSNTKNNSNNSATDKEFTTGGGDEILDSDTVLELYTWWKYIKYGAIILAAVGGTYLGLKLFRAARLKKGLTRTQATAELVEASIRNRLPVVPAAKKAVKMIEDTVSDPKAAAEMQRVLGVSQTDLDALLDLLGVIDWNEFQKKTELEYRQAYYVGQRTLKGKIVKMKLEDYLILNYTPGTPAYAAAKRWLPIMKQARNGEFEKQLKKLTLENDAGQLDTFNKWFTGKVAEQYGKIIGLEDKYIEALSATNSYGYKNEKYLEPQYSARQLTRNFLKKQPMIPQQIIDMSLANPGRKFIDYPEWKALQQARGHDSSQETYNGLHWAYRIYLHTH